MLAINGDEKIARETTIYKQFTVFWKLATKNEKAIKLVSGTRHNTI